MISDEIPSNLAYEDKWILSKINTLAKEISYNIDKYDLGVACSKIYDFIWNEFCDWYIEMVKPRLYDEKSTNKDAAVWTLNKVLANSLKLLHPIMPFITEEIFAKLYSKDESIMISKWPEYKEELSFENEEKGIEALKEIIVGIRNLRTNMNIHPSKKSNLIFVTSEFEEMINSSKIMLQKLGFAENIEVKQNRTDIPEDSSCIMVDGIEAIIPFGDLVDKEEERKRLESEITKLESEVTRCEKMLSNPGFTSKAPETKINEEKEKLAKYQEMLKSSKERLETIK